MEDFQWKKVERKKSVLVTTSNCYNLNNFFEPAILIAFVITAGSNIQPTCVYVPKKITNPIQVLIEL